MLSDKEIKERLTLNSLDPKQLIIAPFDPECLGPVSYDLHTFQSAPPIRGVRRLISIEQFSMPRDLVGLVCLRSRSSQRGIFASFGPLIDPGFRGQLIFLVWKPENPNLDFSVADLFQVMFFKVGEVDVSYDERKSSTAMERKGFGETKEDTFVESGQFAQY